MYCYWLYGSSGKTENSFICMYRSVAVCTCAHNVRPYIYRFAKNNVRWQKICSFFHCFYCNTQIFQEKRFEREKEQANELNQRKNFHIPYVYVWNALCKCQDTKGKLNTTFFVCSQSLLLCRSLRISELYSASTKKYQANIHHFNVHLRRM